MKSIYYHKINKAELNRIQKLEWADEFEEFDLILSHYFISIAQKYTKEILCIKEVNFNNLSEA